MSKELILFCSIVGIFTVLQSLVAHPLAQAKTVYQLTDTLGWIIDGRAKGSGLDLSLSRYKANEEKRGQRNIERKVMIQDLPPF